MPGGIWLGGVQPKVMGNRELSSLDQLRVFVAVADEGSFSAAGRHLSMSQPGVSKQVKALETHFGVSLFEHRAQHANLTQAGDSLYDLARAVLARVSGIETLMREHRVGLAGRISLGASMAAGTYVVPEIVSSFRQAAPRAEIKLHVVAASDLHAGVRAGRFDLGIGFSPEQPHGLAIEELRATRWLMFVSGGHELLARRPLRPADLVPYTFYMGAEGSPSWKLRLRLLSERGIYPRRFGEAGHPEATKRIVAAGHDIGMLTADSIQHELRAGDLAELSVPGPPFETSLELFSLPDRYQSGVMRAFRDHLKRALAEPPQERRTWCSTTGVQSGVTPRP